MKIIENTDVSEVLWYKIGGTAKYLLEISNRKDMEMAIDFLKEKDLFKGERYLFIGSGSNLIFAKEYFEGAVLRFVKNIEQSSFIIERYDEQQITAFAGEKLDDLIQFGFAHSLIGLEWAGGLPGSVGAAVRGNVGAYGGEIKDSLVSAEIIRLGTDQITWTTVAADHMNFSYRESIVKQNKHLVVFSGTFGLKKATKEELEKAKEIYEKNIHLRKDRHPLEYPNCGSVFKNIREKQQIARVLEVYPDLTEDIEKKWYGKVAVATLIERLGLKGYSVGGAQVSEKHALFIINKDHARAGDVITIIDTIQQKFQETFGFELETEVEIIR